MQQTAPKFMAQVKARFVAPNNGGGVGSSPPSHSEQAQQPHPSSQSAQTAAAMITTPPQQQNRPQRVTSGNFGHSKINKQVSGNLLLSSSQQLNSNQNSNAGGGGALSHRQMQLEPMHHGSITNSSNKKDVQVVGSGAGMGVGSTIRRLQQHPQQFHHHHQHASSSNSTPINQKHHHISLQNLIASDTQSSNQQQAQQSKKRELSDIRMYNPATGSAGAQVANSETKGMGISKFGNNAGGANKGGSGSSAISNAKNNNNNNNVTPVGITQSSQSNNMIYSSPSQQPTSTQQHNNNLNSNHHHQLQSQQQQQPQQFSSTTPGSGLLSPQASAASATGTGDSPSNLHQQHHHQVQSQSQQMSAGFQWHPEQSIEPQFSQPHASSGHQHHHNQNQHLNYSQQIATQQHFQQQQQQQQQQNIPQHFQQNHLIQTTTNSSNPQMVMFQPHTSPTIAQGNTSPIIGGSSQNQANDLGNKIAGGQPQSSASTAVQQQQQMQQQKHLNTLAAQFANQPVSASQALPRQQPILPFGFVQQQTANGNNPADFQQQQNEMIIKQQLQQRLLQNANMLSAHHLQQSNKNANGVQQFTTMDQNHHVAGGDSASSQGTTIFTTTSIQQQNNVNNSTVNGSSNMNNFEMINGVQLGSGKRLPNFQINKQLQQQVIVNNSAVAGQSCQQSAAGASTVSMMSSNANTVAINDQQNNRQGISNIQATTAAGEQMSQNNQQMRFQQQFQIQQQNSQHSQNNTIQQQIMVSTTGGGVQTQTQTQTQMMTTMTNKHGKAIITANANQNQHQQQFAMMHQSQQMQHNFQTVPSQANSSTSQQRAQAAPQLSANQNLMKQLYSAKGGVQTPPANFKGSSSSVGSRRQSGESSGMMSMGSIGTNFNEGNDVVQKPLVREFKTQGRLNRGIMPGANSQEDTAAISQHNTNLLQRGSTGNKVNNVQSNFAKRASPRQDITKAQQQHIGPNNTIVGKTTRPNVHHKRAGAGFNPNATSSASKDIGALPQHQATVQVLNQQFQTDFNVHGTASKVSSASSQQPNLSSQPQHQIQSARIMTSGKKFKSVSESNAAGSALKSNKQLMKGGNNTMVLKKDSNAQPQQMHHPSYTGQHPQNQFQVQQESNNENDQPSIFDHINLRNPKRNEKELASNTAEQFEFQHPDQPTDDLSPPDLSTFKSQTLPMHNSEGEPPHENISNVSPNKQSFQHSSNQDAVERNEELMSLLACLNEQAIKELNQQDEQEWETGMQRLLKAYKIMVETKNPNSFDANYKAIICYNLACCCQMQSELLDCSKYLTKAIEFVSVKLDHLKEQALSQYNANINQQIQSNSLEQPSLTITNSSIATSTAAAVIPSKNSDLLFEQQQSSKRSSNNQLQQPSSSSKTNSAAPRNAPGQLSASRGSRYNATGNGNSYGAKGGKTNSKFQKDAGQFDGQKMQSSRPIKSPMRAVTGATTNNANYSEKHSRITPAGSRALAQAQTTNSLFSEFNRFANANQKSNKVSQQSLRTISVNNNKGADQNQNQVGNAGGKQIRGIGGQNTKNAQSQAQFSKPGGLFNNLNSNQFGQVGAANSRANKQGEALQRKREAQNNYNAQQQQHIQQESQGGHGGAQSKKTNSIREAKKAKASKNAPQIGIQNWLECYNKNSNRPTREILERSIHLTRYHCRFVLQLCAVLSQLNEHEQALQYSKKASGLASQLTEMTLILIKDELKPTKSATNAANADNSAICDQSSQKQSSSRRRKHSTSNQLDPYNTSLSKQKTTVSARFANQGTKGLNSQNSSLVQSNLNQLSKDKVSQSYTMSNFHQLGAKEQQSSQALNNSGMALSYFPNPEQVKIERESLERIHTFSLKEPIDLNGSDDHMMGAQTLTTGNFLDPLFGSNTDRAMRGGANDPDRAGGAADKHNLSMDTPFSGNRQRGISEGSRNSSTASNRSCSQYVPEKVKIFQKQMTKTHGIVNELIEIQKEFLRISEWNFKERRDYFQDRMAEKKKLKISFQTFEEMSKLQIEQKFKITARSALGVKNYGTDDWIFSFNIGNIMHLQTLGFDDLANSKTTQSMMKGADSKQNNGLLKAGISGSVTTQQAIRNYLMSEISKDELLYKALYVIVSYFCIGTELRFLATLNPQQYSLKDSEIWHAKAIHIASYFLPNDCPLIQHITQSYAKHHLRPKIKRRQDQLAVLAANQ